MKTQLPGEYFRAGVGAMVVDPASDRVLVLRRADITDSDAWQLPQGGIESGESPRDALEREVSEEVGLAPDDYEIIDEVEDWLAYELPEDFRSAKTGRGQVQKWYLLRLRSSDTPIHVDQREFNAWRWVPADELVRLAAPFRRSVYRRLVQRPTKGGTGST